MYLVESHIVKKQNPIYNELDKFSFLSKNLYNQVLYRIRQEYFESKKYLGYNKLCHQLTLENQIDYTSLPRKVSQQVIKQVDQNFKSFFGSLKSGKVNHKVHIPRYLSKDGRNLLVFTNQVISSHEIKNGFLKLSGCEWRIKILHRNVQQVRVIPRGNHFVIEVLYKKEPKSRVVSDNFVGLDLGLNNLITCGGNTTKSFIINGRPVKSINQFFNKKLSSLKSRQDKLKNNKVNSKRIKSLFEKRNNKIKDYLHKSSRVLVNQLVSNNVSKVIIGHNKEWKQDISLGKRNNQNFVQIPYNDLIHMITYKCELEGIEVIEREESYTSKCSFLDGEEIKKHDSYLGKRIKRGLFRSSSGKLINADLNGALNILKKEIPNAFSDSYGIEVCSTPLVLTIK